MRKASSPPLEPQSSAPQAMYCNVEMVNLQGARGVGCLCVCVCERSCIREGSDPLSLNPLWVTLCLREPSSPLPASTESPHSPNSPTYQPWQGQLGEPGRGWLLLLPGTNTPGEPSEHAGLQRGLQEKSSCSETEQPANNDFPCTCACCKHFYHFAMLH